MGNFGFPSDLSDLVLGCGLVDVSTLRLDVGCCLGWVRVSTDLSEEVNGFAFMAAATVSLNHVRSWVKTRDNL